MTTFDDPAGTWNRRYSQDGYLFGTAPNAWLAEHAGVWHPGQRVLCVADGEGRNSVWLASRGLVVDAFDIAEVGVAKARQLAASQGVTVGYTLAGCDDFTWTPGAWDGVAAIFVQFADPALRTRLFAHIVSALKPGGTCTRRTCCARLSRTRWTSWNCATTRPRCRRAAATAAARR